MSSALNWTKAMPLMSFRMWKAWISPESARRGRSIWLMSPVTTNFALTFYAVANELESLNVPSYLVVTPAEGMSVLTAWSAEKFTSKMVANTLKKFDLQNKVKTRNIIIPGLLAHMKAELEEELKKAGLEFKITVGTIEAYKIADFVKELS